MDEILNTSSYTAEIYPNLQESLNRKQRSVLLSSILYLAFNYANINSFPRVQASKDIFPLLICKHISLYQNIKTLLLD